MTEHDRLAELTALAVLDTEPEQVFDDLVVLASRIANVPTALLSLVDAERQWFKAKIGLEVCSTSRDVAFCDHVVRAGDELEVHDARLDPRFADNPLVTGEPHIVFYAGFPLVSRDGLVIGSLCVIDAEPRALDSEQRHGLQVLARQVMTQLELRRRTAEQAVELEQRRVMGLELARSHRAYQLMAEHSTDIISRHNPDGRVTYVSPAVRTVLGLDPAQEITEDAKGQVHADDLPRLVEARGSVAGGESAVVTVRSRHLDGSWRWMECTLSPLLDPQSGVVEVYSAARDVTDRVLATQELARQAEFTRAVLDSVEVGIVACDAEGRLTLFNPATREWHGIPANADLAPQEWPRHFDLCRPDGVTLLERDEVPLYRALTEGSVQGAEMVIAAHGRPVRLVRCDGRALHDGDGAIVGAVVGMIDITAEREASREAHESHAYLRAVLAASPDFLFITDVTTGAVVYGSPGKQVLGWTGDQLKALGPELVNMLVHPEDQGRVRSANAASADVPDGEVLQVRYRGRHVDDTWRWLSRRITPFRRNEAGLVVEVLGAVRDVTDVVQAEDKLMHAALHDSLTGLPNRLLLQDRLIAALQRAGESGREIAVLFLDLDGFKRVNDTGGHAAGDVVLLETARRMAAVLRPQDTIARVGGDEFVVVVEPQDRAELAPAGERGEGDAHLAEPARALALTLAERLNRAVAAPVPVGQLEHTVTVSIGVTFAAGRGTPEAATATAEQLLQDADAAMYEAKTHGKDHFRVFESSLRTDLAERGRVEQELRWAVGTGMSAQPGAGLSVAYQPIIGPDGRLTGFEALARLTGRDGQSVSPEVFIPLAEETGLIRQLGGLVLDAACAQLAAWRIAHAGLDDVTMAVNVSGVQAQHPGLSDLVSETLNSHGLAPTDLVLELTETALLHAANSTISHLRGLREAGVRIAIDDFGVGYASLKYLATLPVSDVKVDRSFTAGVPHDVVATRIVHAVASLAADLQLGCVVEGVETQEQRDALPPGVQLQGWLLGRPAAPGQLDLTRHLLTASGARPT